MRRVTIIFLIAEALDFITTYIGLKIGVAELNPLPLLIGWNWTIAFKLFMILLVAFILEKKKLRWWFDLAVPIVVSAFVIWNVINLIPF